MHRWNTKKRQREGGFTLLEMVVSLGILTVVVLIGVGSLLTIVDSNRKAQAEKSVMNNLQFAVDSMTRTMRVGTTYHCGASGDLGNVADCAVSGASTMAFEPSGGDPGTTEDQVVYRLVGTTLERSTDGGTNYIAVTAPEVIIDTLTFYVDGAEVANSQPRVLIVIQGHVGEADKERTDFSIETLVSQRALE
ncbi:prepilin-type N-terminal cleavage/methylation domain-containing protein [Candidatus Wolfebacteria bacterium]|nr:prepilin-type N-terminal cleavage/methylation domain-containing protein [Candidatus Wolfebacteria bacterium]